MVTFRQLLYLIKTISIISLVCGINPVLHPAIATTISQTSDRTPTDAEKLRQEANQLLQIGKSKEAIVKFEQALAIFRSNKDLLAQAITLDRLGEAYYRLGQYPQAIDAYQQALVIATEIGNLKGKANVLDGLGAVYYALSQYPKAIEYLEQALAIKTKLGDRIDKGPTLNNLGSIYSGLGQFKKAIKYYQEALSIVIEVGDFLGQESILSNLGEAYSNLDEYPTAVDYYQKALKIAKQLGDRRTEASILTNLGLTYDHSGDYQKSIEYYQKSLTIAQELGNRAVQTATLINLGGAYHAIDRYQTAIEYYQKALIIAQEIGDRRVEAATFGKLGGVYGSLGQYPKAIEYFQQDLTIKKAIGDRAGQGAVLGSLGVYHAYLGKYEQAIDYDVESLKIAREVGNRTQEGNALNSIGGLYAKVRLFDDALKYYQQALTIYRTTGNPVGEISTLNNIGVVYFDRNQFTLALKNYRQAEIIAHRIGAKASEGLVLSNQGRALYHLKRLREAEVPLRAAIKIWESLRAGLTDKDKISFADKVAGTYTLLQKVLIEQNKIPAALEISERGRARALAELLAGKILTTNSATSEKIRQAPSLSKIQQIAKTQNATLVQYSIVDNSIYIWVIKPNGNISFKQSPVPVKTNLKDLVIATRDSMGGDNNNPTVRPTNNLKRLYKLLIAPIAAELPKQPEASVIILPQNELFSVPFAALQTPQGKYLIEQHTITIAPSIQVLGFANGERPRRQGTPLVVGNPIMPFYQGKQLGNLNGTEQEARSIGQILQVKPLIRGDAGKQQVIDKMRQAPIIHLATHGLLGTIKGDIPGAIALTNGFLTSGEIFDMELEADLVVLSACYTGRGDVTGDGVVGLSRSLSVAGVPSVIVSLWAVSDESTKELMENFYQNFWVKKLSKAQSIRQAMLKTMQKYPDPDLWAAFMLVGEGR
jgi:CHAT domain-containing protein/Tfp pilus assembly protein PilF